MASLNKEPLQAHARRLNVDDTGTVVALKMKTCVKAFLHANIDEYINDPTFAGLFTERERNAHRAGDGQLPPPPRFPPHLPPSQSDEDRFSLWGGFSKNGRLSHSVPEASRYTLSQD